MIKSQWELFQAGPFNVNPQRIHITLNPKGTILLNHKAVNVLGSPAAVQLYFDYRRAMIGIKPVDAEQTAAFPLKRSPKNTHRLIRASSFCRHYNIAVERTIQFNDPELNPEGMLILNLQTISEIGKIVVQTG